MIRVKKGLNIPIEGLPEQKVCKRNKINHVAILGEDYIGIKPKIKVKEGDLVKTGDVLFVDKQYTSICFTAPVSGVIKAINRGHKRVLESVVIQKNDAQEDPPPNFELEPFDNLNGQNIKSFLLKTGLWTSFRTRPFSKIPNPESNPHSLFVTAIDTRPLSPDPEIVIELHQKTFSHGLQILTKMKDCPVYVCTASETNIVVPKGIEKKAFSGPHPAGLPGTHIHFVDPVDINKEVWHLNYQDVIAIGHFFLTGTLWQERVISLAGPTIKKPRLMCVPLGASLHELTHEEITIDHHRIISGSVLDGRAITETTAYLGRYHLQVSVLEEGNKRTSLHYMRAGFNRFSVMPIYVSHFLKKTFSMTTSTNGSPRAMVPVGSYEKVMPLDILPTQLLRSLIVGDVEMSQTLGALELDEEDLALCTFVCPGKYEYGPILRDNLTKIEKEG